MLSFIKYLLPFVTILMNMEHTPTETHMYVYTRMCPIDDAPRVKYGATYGDAMFI